MGRLSLFSKKRFTPLLPGSIGLPGQGGRVRLRFFPWKKLRSSGWGVTGLAEFLFLGVIATLPFQVALSPFSGADVLLARVLVPSLFLAWVVQKKISIPTLLKDPIAIFLGAFVLVAAVSLVGAENISWGVRKLFVFISLFPFYVVAKDMLESSHMRYQALRILFLSVMATVFIGTFQFAGQFVFGVPALEGFMERVAPVLYGEEAGKEILAYKSWFVNIGGETYFRAFSFFKTPQLFAMFLGMTILLPFGQYLAARDRGTGSQRFLFSVFSVGLLGIVLSFSRGAYLATLVTVSGTFLLALLAKAPLRRLGMGTTVFVAFLFLTTGVVGSTTFSERFDHTTDIREGSNRGRLAMWEVAIDAFEEKPLLGFGLGQFPLKVDPRTYYRSPINAHNTYFEILAEQGMLGLIAWLGAGLFAMFCLFRHIIRQANNKGEKEIFLALGVLGSLVYFFLHASFETTLYSPTILLSYLFLLAFARRITKSRLL